MAKISVSFFFFCQLLDFFFSFTPSAAFCKNTVDGTWEEFDDRHVCPMPDAHVVSKSAYILFYQRRSLSKLINQRLHRGVHWVFTLHQHLTDKSCSPLRRRGSDGSPVKKGGIQEDLEQVASTPFDRRVFSKEWNGQSSPTRRPTNRPLTPQPQRRQTSLELGMYDQSPTVIKPRPSFRTTRPTLSRQVSDAAVRAKKQLYQDSDGAGRQVERGEQRGEQRGEPRYNAGQPGSKIQPQILQVQLPPKKSPDHDLMGSEVPRPQTSDMLQPQQIGLPSQSPKDMKLSSLQQRAGPEQNRDLSQSSRSPSSSSGHQHAPPASVDARTVDSTYCQHPDQVRQQPASALPLPRDSHPSQSGRPWQYESQSSRSSHDTQSSHDSQRSQPSPGEFEPPKSPYSSGSSNGNEFYDWRQPEARVDKRSEKRNSGHVSSPSKPATAVTSRVNSKPPLPPKILTRSADASRSNGSASSPMHRQDDFHVTVTTPSLTSPPSPAPKDSVRDIQRRLSQQEPQLTQPEPRLTRQEPRLAHQEPRLAHQEPRLAQPEPRLTRLEPRLALPEPQLTHKEPPHSDRSSQGERFITLNDEQQWGRMEPVPADRKHAEDRHVLKDGEFEKRRSKIASQITGEKIYLFLSHP